MLKIKTGDIDANTEKVAGAIQNGETVVVARPKKQNWVILSEAAYNDLQKARRNLEYLEMLDASMQDIENGRTVSFESVEALTEYVESLIGK